MDPSQYGAGYPPLGVPVYMTQANMFQQQYPTFQAEHQPPVYYHPQPVHLPNGSYFQRPGQGHTGVHVPGMPVLSQNIASNQRPLQFSAPPPVSSSYMVPHHSNPPMQNYSNPSPHQPNIMFRSTPAPSPDLSMTWSTAVSPPSPNSFNVNNRSTTPPATTFTKFIPPRLQLLADQYKYTSTSPASETASKISPTFRQKALQHGIIVESPVTSSTSSSTTTGNKPTEAQVTGFTKMKENSLPVKPSAQPQLTGFNITKEESFFMKQNLVDYYVKTLGSQEKVDSVEEMDWTVEGDNWNNNNADLNLAKGAVDSKLSHVKSDTQTDKVATTKAMVLPVSKPVGIIDKNDNIINWLSKADVKDQDLDNDELIDASEMVGTESNKSNHAVDQQGEIIDVKSDELGGIPASQLEFFDDSDIVIEEHEFLSGHVRNSPFAYNDEDDDSCFEEDNADENDKQDEVDGEGLHRSETISAKNVGELEPDVQSGNEHVTSSITESQELQLTDEEKILNKYRKQLEEAEKARAELPETTGSNEIEMKASIIVKQAVASGVLKFFSTLSVHESRANDKEKDTSSLEKVGELNEGNNKNMKNEMEKKEEGRERLYSWPADIKPAKETLGRSNTTEPDTSGKIDKSEDANSGREMHIKPSSKKSEDFEKFFFKQLATRHGIKIVSPEKAEKGGQVKTDINKDDRVTLISEQRRQTSTPDPTVPFLNPESPEFKPGWKKRKESGSLRADAAEFTPSSLCSSLNVSLSESEVSDKVPSMRADAPEFIPVPNKPKIFYIPTPKEKKEKPSVAVQAYPVVTTTCVGTRRIRTMDSCTATLNCDTREVSVNTDSITDALNGNNAIAIKNSTRKYVSKAVNTDVPHKRSVGTSMRFRNHVQPQYSNKETMTDCTEMGTSKTAREQSISEQEKLKLDHDSHTANLKQKMKLLQIQLMHYKEKEVKEKISVMKQNLMKHMTSVMGLYTEGVEADVLQSMIQSKLKMLEDTLVQVTTVTRSTIAHLEADGFISDLPDFSGILPQMTKSPTVQYTSPQRVSLGLSPNRKSAFSSTQKPQSFSQGTSKQIPPQSSTQGTSMQIPPKSSSQGTSLEKPPPQSSLLETSLQKSVGTGHPQIKDEQQNKFNTSKNSSVSTSDMSSLVQTSPKFVGLKSMLSGLSAGNQSPSRHPHLPSTAMSTSSPKPKLNLTKTDVEIKFPDINVNSLNLEICTDLNVEQETHVTKLKSPNHSVGKTSPDVKSAQKSPVLQKTKSEVCTGSSLADSVKELNYLRTEKPSKLITAAQPQTTKKTQQTRGLMSLEDSSEEEEDKEAGPDDNWEVADTLDENLQQTDSAKCHGKPEEESKLSEQNATNDNTSRPEAELKIAEGMHMEAANENQLEERISSDKLKIKPLKNALGDIAESETISDKSVNKNDKKDVTKEKENDEVERTNEIVKLGLEGKTSESAVTMDFGTNEGSDKATSSVANVNTEKVLEEYDAGKGDGIDVKSKGDSICVKSEGVYIGVKSKGDSIGVKSKGDSIGVKSKGDSIGVKSKGDSIGVKSNETKNIIGNSEKSFDAINSEKNEDSADNVAKAKCNESHEKILSGQEQQILSENSAAVEGVKSVNIDVNPKEVYLSPQKPLAGFMNKANKSENVQTSVMEVMPLQSSAAISPVAGVCGMMLGNLNPALYQAVVSQLVTSYPEMACNPGLLMQVAVQQTGLLQMYMEPGPSSFQQLEPGLGSTGAQEMLGRSLQSSMGNSAEGVTADTNMSMTGNVDRGVMGSVNTTMMSNETLSNASSSALTSVTSTCSSPGSLSSTDLTAQFDEGSIKPSQHPPGFLVTSPLPNDPDQKPANKVDEGSSKSSQHSPGFLGNHVTSPLPKDPEQKHANKEEQPLTGRPPGFCLGSDINVSHRKPLNASASNKVMVNGRLVRRDEIQRNRQQLTAKTVPVNNSKSLDYGLDDFSANTNLGARPKSTSPPTKIESSCTPVKFNTKPDFNFSAMTSKPAPDFLPDYAKHHQPVNTSTRVVNHFGVNISNSVTRAIACSDQVNFERKTPSPPTFTSNLRKTPPPSTFAISQRKTPSPLSFNTKPSGFIGKKSDFPPLNTSEPHIFGQSSTLKKIQSPSMINNASGRAGRKGQNENKSMPYISPVKETDHYNGQSNEINGRANLPPRLRRLSFKGNQGPTQPSPDADQPSAAFRPTRQPTPEFGQPRSSFGAVRQPSPVFGQSPATFRPVRQPTPDYEQQRVLSQPLRQGTPEDWSDEIDDHAPTFRLHHDVNRPLTLSSQKSKEADSTNPFINPASRSVPQVKSSNSMTGLCDIQLPKAAKPLDEEKKVEEWHEVPTRRRRHSSKEQKKEVRNFFAPYVNSAPVSTSKDQRSSNFERLVGRLQEEFPHAQRQEVIDAIQKIRDLRGSLSGLSMEAIIEKCHTFIQTRAAQPKIPGLWTNPKPAQTLNLPPRLKAETVMQESLDEEICVICHDPLMSEPVKELDCRHAFHTQCISQWVERERTCPTCRKHALFPEEFPRLGK